MGNSHDKLWVKFCGMTHVEDAQLAADLGVDAIGLIFYPESPRYLTTEQAADICEKIPRSILKVAVFVDLPIEKANSILTQLPIDLAQCHGNESIEYCQQLSKPYIKAQRMQPNSDLEQICEEYHDARALLLDAYQQNRPGGTGVTFNWNDIPSHLSLPIILAGGLTPDNVGAAIKSVKPYGVDVVSGIESRPGRKDPVKMRAFVQEVRALES